jgi:hypothetical protein
MRNLFFNLSMLLLLSMFNLGFSQISGEVGVKIDGKQISPQEEYVFNVDEPLKFEAEGLKPNSEIEIKIHKMGFPIQKEIYKVGKDGKVFEVLETPDFKMKCKVDVCYWTFSGKEEKVQFRLIFK